MSNNEKYFVLINNNWFDISFRKKYGNESLLLLALIQLNKLVRKGYIFNLDFIYDKLNISSTNTTQKNKIKNCLSKLIKDEVIISDIDISTLKNSKLITVDLAISNDDYTVILDNEINVILSSSNNVFNLFYLFSFIKYRINPSTKVCFWSIKDFQKQMGISSNNTVSVYIDVLENELKLIKKINPGNRIFKNGTIKQSNNIYTINDAHADEILVKAKEKYENELEENDIKITKAKNANEKRRIKAKLYHLEKRYNQEKITKEEYEHRKSILEKEYEKYEYDKEKNINENLFNCNIISFEITEDEEFELFG